MGIGWNTAFAWLSGGNGLTYTIVSYGKNHTTDGCVAGTRTTTFNEDICFAEGQFVQWPEGMQVD